MEATTISDKPGALASVDPVSPAPGWIAVKEPAIPPQPLTGLLSPPCGGDGERISALLESRHETMLQWCEPWPACGPEGNDLDAAIIHRATVHDCINLSRRAAKAAGRPTMGDDANHLLDFIAIHWAKVIPPGAAE